MSGYKRTPSLSRNVIKMPHVWPHIASCCFCCYCQQSHNTLSILRYLYEQIQIIPPLSSLPPLGFIYTGRCWSPALMLINCRSHGCLQILRGLCKHRDFWRVWATLKNILHPHTFKYIKYSCLEEMFVLNNNPSPCL